MNEERFFIQRDFLMAGYYLYFRSKSYSGRPAYAQEVTLKVTEPEEEGMEVKPMMRIGEGALQTMMDELWKEGFRPKDIGTAGHLAATQAHLTDMKKLVSKAYRVEL